MARLYDRVVTGDYTPPDWVVPSRDLLYPSFHKRFIETAPVIVADNVARYLYQGTDQEVWRIDEDFPCIAPPFSHFWMETRAPSTVVSEVHGTNKWMHPIRSWGALFAADENTTDDDRWRWRINAYVWWRLPRGIYGPVGGLAYFVDKQGRHTYAGHEHATARIVDKEFAAREPERAERQAKVVEAGLDSFLLALSFMHCKNVGVRDVTPPAPLSKKWEKKHGRPQVTYKVLDIDPMKKTLESEGGASTNGIKKALHICRGHFATYTEDAPLFGHFVGTVWKPQHVRGSAEAGAVVKDYNVKAPS